MKLLEKHKLEVEHNVIMMNYNKFVENKKLYIIKNII